MSRLRDNKSALAEKVWYLVAECVDSGFNLVEIVDEVGHCIIEVHRQRADEAQQDLKELLRNK